MRLSSAVPAICTLLSPLAVFAQVAPEATQPPPTESASSSPSTEPAPPEAAPAPTASAVVAAPPAEAATAPAPAIAFGWEALVDAYYMYNFTGDPKTQAPLYRNFDTTANNFALSYAKLGVHADIEQVSFRLDFGYGHTPAIINAGSALLSAPGSDEAATDTQALYGSAFLVQQAFATVRPTAYLSIDAGRFVTSAGAEVIETNKNWLYSRSMLFYGIPLLHTGLRINAALLGTIAAPELVLSFQLVNGWNNDPDINSDKTFGLNLTYTPANLGLTAAATSYIGKEVAGADTTIVVDAVVLKDLGNLSLGLNVDYAKSGTPYWLGAAAMARFILNDAFNVAARAEYVYSKAGGYGAITVPTTDKLSFYELTGMVAWTVGKHYELRIEGRADLANQEVFVKGATPRKNQITGLVGALAYF
jgi:hypothetical protein